MKTETLQFKVSEQERKLIERCAKEEGTTVSRYARASVLMMIALDGNGEAIRIIAREVGDKAFAEVRRRFMFSRSASQPE